MSVCLSVYQIKGSSKPSKNSGQHRTMLVCLLVFLTVSVCLSVCLIHPKEFLVKSDQLHQHRTGIVCLFVFLIVYLSVYFYLTASMLVCLSFWLLYVLSVSSFRLNCWQDRSRPLTNSGQHRTMFVCLSDQRRVVLVCLIVCLSDCLSVCLFVPHNINACLSVCLPVCLILPWSSSCLHSIKVKVNFFQILS